MIYLEDGATFTETINLSDQSTALTFSGGWDFINNIQGTTTTLDAPINIIDSSGAISFYNIIFGSAALITINDSPRVLLQGTNADDDIHLGVVDNSGAPAGGDPAYLTVDGGGGEDTVVLSGDVLLNGGDLSIDAETIQVDGGGAGLTISTRQVGGADQLNGTSTGDSGDISLSGKTITIENTRMLAHTVPGSTYSAGNITLEALDETLRQGQMLSPVYINTNTATVTLSNAMLRGGDITIAATAEDQNWYDDLGEYSDKFVAGLTNLLNQIPGIIISAITGVSGQVAIRHSEAGVSITDSSITGTGSVTVGSTATADASLHTVSISGMATSGRFTLSFGYGEAHASATTTLAGNTSITAAGSVDITSSATTGAFVKSRTNSNFLTSSNPKNISLSVAVANTNETSHVTVSAGTAIVSESGGVTIDAQGGVLNFAWSQPTINEDGTTALAFALDFDQADIRSEVDGHVDAAATEPGHAFSANDDVDYDGDTITITGHGFQNGQAVIYSAGTITAGGIVFGAPPIGGLEAGETYYVLVIDENTIQLAEAPVIDLAYENPYAGENPQHSLGRLAQIVFDSADVDVANNWITLNGHGFTGGEAIIYNGTFCNPDAAGNEQNSGVEGLLPGVTYYVERVNDNQFRLLTDPADPLSVADLTSAGVGTHAFLVQRNVQTFAPETAVDNAGNTITIANHGFNTGDAVIYHTDPSLSIERELDPVQFPGEMATIADEPIEGLEDGLVYFVVAVDANTFCLTSSRWAADHAGPVDLVPGQDAGNGLGDEHSLAKPGQTDGIFVHAGLSAVNAVNANAVITDDKFNGWTKFWVGQLTQQADRTILQAENLLVPLVKVARDALSNQSSKGPVQAQTGDDFGIAGSVAFNYANHTVEAIIGSSAVLTSSGDISVVAEISQGSQVASVSGATKPSNAGSSASVAVAIGLGIFNNTARATVAGGAQLDAYGVITVDSQVKYNFLIAEAQMAVNPLEYLKSSGPDGYAYFQDGTLGFASNLFNTFVMTSASQSKVAGGGSIAINIYNNTAETRLVNGAQINQKDELRFRAGPQTVDLQAGILMNLIGVVGVGSLSLNLSGVWKSVTELKNAIGTKNKILGGLKQLVNPFGAEGDKGGIGASFLVEVFTNRAEAVIEGGVRVYTGADADGAGLTVAATTDIFDVSVVQAGSKASSFAVGGAFAVQVMDNTSLAHIDSGAMADSTGSITLSALDDLLRIGIAGGVVAADNIGAGVSVSVNIINRDTEAYIGTGHEAAAGAAGTDISADGPISLSAASDGALWTVALAAAFVSQPPSEKEIVDNERIRNAPAKAQKLLGETGSDPQNLKIGVGIAGDVSVNVVLENTYVYINDTGRVASDAALTLTSISDTEIWSLAGSVAISQRGEKTSYGLAGSISANAIRGGTSAWISGRTNDRITVAAASLSVNASRTGGIRSLTAAGSGAPVKEGIAIAGSISANLVLTDVEAYLSNADVTLTGGATIQAQDETQIWSIGGAVAYGGKAGVGIGVAINVMGTESDPNGTRAWIEDSALTTIGGTLLVEASSENPDMDPRIISIAGSLGIGKGQNSLAGAGTISVNLIENDTQAFIRRATITEAAAAPDPGALNTQIVARDTSGIVTISGAVGVAQSKSLGAAVSYNEIANGLYAFLEDVNLTADGSLTIEADSEALIGAVAVGVAASTSSGKFAGAGSLSINKIDSSIDAHVFKTASGASTITIGSNLELTATDEARILSITGGVAGSVQGGTALGAAISYNLIQNQIQAYIEGATVDVTGSGSSIAISATSEASLIAIAVGGAGAKTFAFGGSLTVNAIANTLDAHIADTPQVSADGNISLTAAGSDSMLVVAGGIGIATKGAAVGAAVAYNYIGSSFDPANPNLLDEEPTVTDQVSAYIDNAHVVAGGDIVLAAGYHPAAGSLVTPELTLVDSRVQVAADSGALDLASLDLDGTRILTITVGGAGADEFALGGAVSINVTALDIQAYITGPRSVKAGDSLLVSAADGLEMGAVAGGFALTVGKNGGGMAIGIAVAIQITKNSVGARLGPGTMVDAGAQGDGVLTFDGTRTGDTPGTTTVKGVVVSAVSFEDTLTLAAGGAVAASNQGLGIAGSTAVTVLSETTKATIAEGSMVNTTYGLDHENIAQSVLVFASDITDHTGIGGGVAFGRDAGIGAGIDVGVINKNTEAHIGSGAIVEAQGNVQVRAVSEESIFSLAAGGGIGKEIGIAGAVDVYVMDITTRAFIEGQRLGYSGAVVWAGDSVLVAAEEKTSLDTISGNLAFGKSAGLGGAAGVPVITKTTEAFIGSGAVVNAKAGILVQEYQLYWELLNNGSLLEDVFVLDAAGVQNLYDIAAKVTGVAEPTDWQVQQTAAGWYNILNEHGSLQGDTFVLDEEGIDLLRSQVAAYLGLADATDEQVQWFGNMLYAKLQGSGSLQTDYFMLTDDGVAVFHDRAAQALGIPEPTATQVRAYADGLYRAVMADFDDDLGPGWRTWPDFQAENPNFGSADGITVWSGAFDVSYESESPAQGEVSPVDPDNSNVNDPALTGQRVAGLNLRPGFHGVAVTAVNRDDLETYGVGASASTNLSFQLSASVNVMDIDTRAYIASGAQVNQDPGGVGIEQSVLVAAGNDYYHMGIAGAAALTTGAGAVSPGADVVVVDLNTEAFIGDGARVSAAKDIRVIASACEDILSIAASLAVSGGTLGGAGAVSVIILDNKTHAYIGDNAVISAGGNIVISATDTTDVDVIAGAVGGSLGGGGIGAGVGVIVIDKDTRAYIGQNAQVDAAGNSDDLVVFDGTLDEAGNFGKTDATDSVRGLVVTAYSSEDIFATAAAGGLGASFGLAGAVTVVVIDSDTLAYIEAGTAINTGITAANDHQDVRVTAVNDLSMLAIDGVLAGGASGGLAGGVAVGVLRNDTAAYIAASDVRARRDVVVSALADRAVQSYTVSAAGGAVGIGAAVAVYTLGGDIQESYSFDANDDGADESENPLTDGGGDSASGYTDSQIGAPGFGEMLAAYSGTGGQVGYATGQAGMAFTDSLPQNPVGGATVPGSGIPPVGGTQAIPAGTSAFVAPNVNIIAGRDMRLNARERVDLDVIAGGVGIGGWGLGAGIAILTFDEHVQASIGRGATIRAAAVEDGGDISVQAWLKSDLSVLAVTAGFGATVGLAGSVVVVTDSSSVSAGIEAGTDASDGARLLGADQVDLKAERNAGIHVSTLSASGGIYGALGASVDITEIGGSTQARVGAWTQIGEESDPVNGLDIQALSTTAIGYFPGVGTMAIGLAVSFACGGAGAAGVALANIHDTTVTEIEAHAVIHAAGEVQVSAHSNASADVDADGGALGGLAIGGMIARAEISGSTRADVGQSAEISAGSLGVASLAEANADVDTVGAAGGLIAGSASVSLAKVTPTVTAYIDGEAVIAADETAVSAEARLLADAEALGFDVGGAAVGVSYAEATSGGSVWAYVAGGSRFTRGSLTVTAIRQPYTSGGLSANANAVAGTGGLLLGANATVANASSGGWVKANIENGVQLPDGDVGILASSSSKQAADASGVAVGFVGAGASIANASSQVTTEAILGNVITDQGRTGLLIVRAAGQDQNNAITVAGSGGVVAGNASVAGTYDNSTVTARIEAGTDLTTGGLLLDAQHTSLYGAVADSINAAVVGGSGAVASNTLNTTALALLGASVQIHAGVDGTVVISAENDFQQVQSGVYSGGGGGISIMAAVSTTMLTGTARVELGEGALIATGRDPVTGRGIILAASSSLIASDRVTLQTGGVINGSGTNSQLYATLNNQIEIGAGARLSSSGAIAVGTHTTVNAATASEASTWGLAAVGAAYATTDVTSNQTIHVGAGADLRAFGNLDLSAGTAPEGLYETSLTGSSRAQGYARGLVAIPIAEADTNLRSNTSLTIDAGAFIGSGQHVTLGAFPGPISATADGTARGYELGFIPVTIHDSDVHTSTSADLTHNGEAMAGAYHELSITIPAGAQDCSALVVNPDGALFAPFTCNYIPQAVPDSSSTASGAFHLGPLYASGGSLIVNADRIQGSGTLEAYGGAAITVENDSPEHLVLGPVEIPITPGGKVLFTGAAGEAEAGGLTILRSGEGLLPVVAISNTYYVDPSNASLKGPTIYLTGTVLNMAGRVSITNVSGSIEQTAGIYAAQVNISAPRGVYSVDLRPPESYAVAIPETMWRNYMIWPGGNPYTSTTLNADYAVAYAINARFNANSTYSSQISYDQLVASASEASQYHSHCSFWLLWCWSYHSHLPELPADEYGAYLFTRSEVIGLAGWLPPENVSYVYYGNCNFTSYSDCSYGTATGFSPIGAAMAIDPWGGPNYFWHALVPVLPTSRTATDWSQADLSGVEASAIRANQISIRAQYIDINAKLEAGQTDWSVELSADLGMNLTYYKIAYSILSSFGIGLNPVVKLEYDPAGDGWQTAGLHPGDSVISAQFDCRTNQITLDNVVAYSLGSFIRLEGGILSSTTLGNLRVNTGYGSVEVDNQTGFGLVVQDIYTGESLLDSGLTSWVEIIDTFYPAGENHWLYEYTYGQGVSVYRGPASATIGQLKLTPPVDSSSGSSALYQPRAGLRWVWQKVATLEREVGFNLDGDTSMATHWYWTNPTTSAGYAWQEYCIVYQGQEYCFWGYTEKIDGSWNTNNPWLYVNPQGGYSELPLGWAVVDEANAGIVFRQTITEEIRAEDWITIAYHGCAGGYGSQCHYGFRATNNNGEAIWDYIYPTDIKITMIMSVKADNPIAINFDWNPAGLVRINSNAAVTLTGQITNPHGDTTINAGGDIQVTPETYIRSTDLSLTATGGIGREGLPLSATLTPGGVLSARAGKQGVYLRLDSGALIGQVSSGNPASGYGDVVLTATGDLQPDGAALLNVAGRDLTLTSAYGSVGNQAAPLVISAHPVALASGGWQDGVVNVIALGDVGLVQVGGILLVDRIQSLSGDVYVGVVAGDLLDANWRTAAQLLDNDEMAQVWDRLNLLGANAEQNAAKSIEDFEGQVDWHYRQYWELRDHGTDLDYFRARAADAYGIEAPSDGQVQQYVANLYANTTTFFDTYLAPSWSNLPEFQAFDPDYGYQVTAEQRARIEDAAWSQAELLYAVSSMGLQPSSGLPIGRGEPNISGRQVTLDVSGTIGWLDQEVVVSLVDLQAGNLSNTEAVALALANQPGDVILQGMVNGGTVRFGFDQLGVNPDNETELWYLLPGLPPEVVTDLAFVLLPVMPVFVEANDLLNVQAGGSIYLQSTVQDLPLGQIVAGGNVNLTAPHSIYGTEDTLTHIATPGNLRLFIGSGSLGLDAGTPLTVQVGGELAAISAAEDVYLRVVGGDFDFNRIDAGGMVWLAVPDGSLYPRQEDTPISAQYVKIDVRDGIGTEALPVLVELATARLATASGGDQYIVIQAGDLYPVPLVSTGGAIYLTVPGAILDGQDALPEDIRALSAVLIAASGIGAASNPLEACIQNLEADAGTGGIWLDNTCSLTIGGASGMAGVTAGGPISLTASGSITILENIASSDAITLTTVDSIDPGEDLLINSGVMITAGGPVQLNAGDNLFLAPLAAVQSPDSVLFRGDYGNADPGVGTLVLLEGIVDAPVIRIFGNRDDDILNGGALTSNLYLEAGDGDDILYGGSGDDLLDGGNGFNIYYGGDGYDTALIYCESTCGIPLDDVERLISLCPPVVQHPIILVINVYSEQIVSLVCDNCDLILLRLLPPMHTVLLAPIAGYQISLTEVSVNDLPGDLLPEYGYLAAMDIQFLVAGLPDQQFRHSMQISFTIPELPDGTLDHFTPIILYWDSTLNDGKGGWVEMDTLLSSYGMAVTYASQPGLYVLALHSLTLGLDCGTGNVWAFELPSGVSLQIPCTVNSFIKFVPIIPAALPGDLPPEKEYHLAFYMIVFRDDTQFEILPNEGVLEHSYDQAIGEAGGVSLHVWVDKGWREISTKWVDETTLQGPMVAAGWYLITAP